MAELRSKENKEKEDFVQIKIVVYVKTVCYKMQPSDQKIETIEKDKLIRNLMVNISKTNKDYHQRRSHKIEKKRIRFNFVLHGQWLPFIICYLVIILQLNFFFFLLYSLLLLKEKKLIHLKMEDEDENEREVLLLALKQPNEFREGKKKNFQCLQTNLVKRSSFHVSNH